MRRSLILILCLLFFCLGTRSAWSENQTPLLGHIGGIPCWFVKTDPSHAILVNLEKVNGLSAFLKPGEVVGDFVVPPRIGFGTNGVDIVGIGENAFQGCDNLESITIPEGVTNIGMSAFSSCAKLQKVVLPKSLESISQDAFGSCPNLRELRATVSGDLVIGAYAFYSCPNLVAVDLVADSCSISNRAFSFCGNLANVGVKASESITLSSAFSNCAKLTHAILEAPRVEIGESSFSGCLLLEGVDILAEAGTVSNLAFKGCRSLQGFSCPPSLVEIGASAFSGCESLENIVFSTNLTSVCSNAFYLCSSLNAVDFPSSLVDIGDSAFYFCEQLSGDVVFPPQMKRVGDYAFMGCSALSRIGQESSMELNMAIGNYAFALCESLSDVVLTNSLTSLGIGSFSECLALTNVLLSQKMTELPAGVFSGCYSLARIDLPTNLVSIGTEAFADCSSLLDFTLPPHLEIIGKNAFLQTAFWVLQPDNQIVHKDGYTLGVKGVLSGTVQLPDGLKRIPDGFFQGMSTLTNIVFSPVLTSIGRNAFSGSGLVSVVIPTNIVEIGTGAFENCADLAEVVFLEPSSLQRLPDNVFRGSGLVEFTVPKGIVEIGVSAFEDSKSLVSVQLPTSVTGICERAFADCINLSTCEIPASVTWIGTNAFLNCSRLNVDENGRSIYYIAFDPNGGVGNVVTQRFAMGVSVNLPSNQFTRANWLFTGWALTERGRALYADGASVASLTNEAGAVVSFYAHWDATKEAISRETHGGVDWYYLSSSEGSKICRWDAGTTNWTVAVEGDVKGELVVPERLGDVEVVGIGTNALKGCTAITSLEVPDSVLTIGDSAFSGCSNLISFTWSHDWNGAYPTDGILEIGKAAFRGCSSLAAVSLPLGISVLPDSLFLNCSALTKSFEMPYTVKRIGASCFSGCTGLTALTVTEYVDEIGSLAFQGCVNLKIVRYLGNPPASVEADIYKGTMKSLVSGYLSVRAPSWKSAVTTTSSTPGTATGVTDEDDDEDEDDEKGTSSPVITSPVTTTVSMWPGSGVDARQVYLWTTKLHEVRRVTLKGNDQGKTKDQELWYVKGRMLGILSDLSEDEFLGWYTAEVGGDVYSPNTCVNEGLTYYAHWAKSVGQTGVTPFSPFYESENEGDADEVGTGLNGEFGYYASTYDGYLVQNDKLAGTILVNVERGRAVSGGTNSAFSAVITLLGSKKLTFKGTIDTEASAFVETGKGTLDLSLTQFDLQGEFSSEELGDFEIYGARNRFSANSADATEVVSRARQMASGDWIVVLKTASADGDGAVCANGYNVFTVSIGTKGTVKTKGVLADGTKVSVSTKLIVGDGCCCAPVLAQLYSGKKGGLGFGLWFTWNEEMTREVTVVGVSDWDASMVKTNPFVATLDVVEGVPALKSSLNGTYAFGLEDGFVATGLTLEEQFYPDVSFTARSAKWALPKADTVKFNKANGGYEIVRDNENSAGLKLSYSTKTGQFQGSFKIYGVTDEGRPMKFTAKVAGAVVNGCGYGTATVKKMGSVPVVVLPE